MLIFMNIEHFWYLGSVSQQEPIFSMRLGICCVVMLVMGRGGYFEFSVQGVLSKTLLLCWNILQEYSNAFLNTMGIL